MFFFEHTQKYQKTIFKISNATQVNNMFSYNRQSVPCWSNQTLEALFNMDLEGFLKKLFGLLPKVCCFKVFI